MDSKKLFFTEVVRDHFFNPRNMFKIPEEAEVYAKNSDGEGETRGLFCGDVMYMWIKVDGDIIKECKWLTFGCAVAISTTSVLSEMAIGMKLDDALKINSEDIINKLGDIPKGKFHCSVLGINVLREAINNYFKKTDQEDRIVENESNEKYNHC